MNRDKIAIIGLSGKFPQSEDIPTFWRNLVEAKTLSRFLSDSELEERGLSWDQIKHPNYVKVSSKVQGADAFDFSFFGYTADEAALMDPQVRLFHEYAWLALEDAGYDPFQYPDKIGLFASAGDNINWRVYAAAQKNENVSGFFLKHISNKEFLPTLVSYKLNLRGPSYFIDTACSSSLASVHLGCQSLINGDCTMSLVGGVKLVSTPSQGYFHQEGMINSADGYCRAFDAEATGTYEGEGIGIVVLKRLEEALRDKDHIYAVIASSATNNDGNRKVGYTAPSIQGQAECIQQAHQFANISPNLVSYIEAHGTGTSLGDPIEIEALNQAFDYQKEKNCAVGSVKSNLGHLDTAAGITGLIKVVLGLHHKIIPPSLHFKEPNPNINFSNGPFFINQETQSWEKEKDSPRYAGVSSFGIGGTNVHIVMEEAPASLAPSFSRKYRLLQFSAKTESALEAYQEKLSTSLKDQAELELANVAFTLQTGRAAHKYKKFLVAESLSEAQEVLEAAGYDRLKTWESQRFRRLVFMFPGQGSQYIQMGKDIYEQEAYFRAIMDRGFSFLQKETGLDFKEILYGGAKEAATINETRYTQPLVFLFEYALAKMLMHWGIRPDAMIGHSLGEYVAACLSGVFSFEDGLKLIIKRATLMQETERGAMLSIEVDHQTVRPFLDGKLSIAAVNSPGSCVLSGSAEAILGVMDVLRKKNISHVRLHTSHAFHSQMMDAILQDFEAAFQGITLAAPKLPFISNVTGDLISAQAATSPAYWVNHLRNTVLFSQGITNLMDQEDTLFLELGPGRTLSSLLKKNDITKAFQHKAIPLSRHPKKRVDDNRFLTEALGELWVNGVEVDWNKYYEAETLQKVSIPSYSFDKHRFPAEVDALQMIYANLGRSKSAKQDLSDWFYSTSWRRSLGKKSGETTVGNSNFLLFSEESALMTGLVKALKATGKNVKVVFRDTAFQKLADDLYTIDVENRLDVAQLREGLELEGFEVDQIVYGWTLSPAAAKIEDTKTASATLEALQHLLCIIQEFGLQQEEVYRKMTILTYLAQDVLGYEQSSLLSHSIQSLLRVSRQENPYLFNCTIDLDTKRNLKKQVQQVLEDLYNNQEVEQVAYRKNVRWEANFAPVSLASNSTDIKVRSQGTYLITGGLGLVGTTLAECLLQQYQANVILLGRTKLDVENPEFTAQIIGTALEDKVKVLQELKDRYQTISYHVCDVADFDSLRQQIKLLEVQYGRIDGVIHAAGNLSADTFRTIENITPTILEDQFSPKVSGLLHFYQLFKDRSLDFFWTTSSLSTVLGGIGYGAYAAANAWMDAFLSAHKDSLPNWYSMGLDGITTGEHPAVINREELKAVFLKSLHTDLGGHLIVSTKDLSYAIQEGENKLKQSIKEKENKVFVERPQLLSNYQEPTNEVEAELASIWQDLFSIDKIGIRDDFFELGGDSLKVITLSKRIFKSFDIEISIQDIFSNLTIKELASEISMAQQLIEMQTGVDESFSEINI